VITSELAAFGTIHIVLLCSRQEFGGNLAKTSEGSPRLSEPQSRSSEKSLIRRSNQVFDGRRAPRPVPFFTRFSFPLSFRSTNKSSCEIMRFAPLHQLSEPDEFHAADRSSNGHHPGLAQHRTSARAHRTARPPHPGAHLRFPRRHDRRAAFLQVREF